MVREVRSDLSLGMESRKVPVEPPQDEAERPYPLFGYSIDSINNPIVQKGCGCRGEQGCTQNRHCECRNKNPGSSSPFFKGTAVLTDDGCTKVGLEMGQPFEHITCCSAGLKAVCALLVVLVSR